MFKINDNYLKLPGSYLFSTIGKKVAAYTAANPDKEVIKLGIGDVTLPLAPAVIKRLHSAVDEMAVKETFKGYAPDLGYEFLRTTIVENDYKARGETIRNAELFRGQFAISECPSDYVDSPTVVGAQAANELLNIVGVKASFVLTEYKGVIYISARAIDEVNVQIIMERMGGGGHLNMAGCQLETVDLEGARSLLKSTLTEMQDGGEI